MDAHATSPTMADARPALVSSVLMGAAWAMALLGFVFLIAPIVVMVPISFSDSSFLNYPITGVTLRWYEEIFRPYPWMQALKNSLIIGLASAVLAVVLGTIGAFGLRLLGPGTRRAVMALFLAPMVVPTVVTGLAIYFLLSRVSLLGTYTGLILAHTVIALPFVVITVSAALASFDFGLLRAANSLGASPLTALMTVAVPQLAPGIVAGAVFAFVTSFDEVIITLFIAAPEQFTLPRQLFAGLRDQLTPSIVAVAVVLMAVSCCLLGAVELLKRRLSGPRRPASP